MNTATAKALEDEIRRMLPIAAPPEQQAGIVEVARVLALLGERRPRTAPSYRLLGPLDEPIALPESVSCALERVVEVLARGDAITVVPVGREMTTQQAADLLNVSRQYLVRLLEEGRIPFAKTGAHRRVRIEDVLAFKAGRDAARRSALSNLTRLTEDMGGYDREMK